MIIGNVFRRMADFLAKEETDAAIIASYTPEEAREALRRTRDRFCPPAIDGKPRMMFRQHRGPLDRSMETLAELEPTMDALREHILSFSGNMPELVGGPELVVTVLIDQPDFRIGWEKTYIVAAEGWGVIGMTDMMPTQEGR